MWAFRRAAHKAHGGLWEFPGGKVEAGEEDRAALAREIAEELGLAVEVGEPLFSGPIEDWGEICFYRCVAQVEPGELRMSDHDEVEAVSVGAGDGRAWAPGDVEFVAWLAYQKRISSR